MLELRKWNCHSGFEHSYRLSVFIVLEDYVIAIFLVRGVSIEETIKFSDKKNAIRILRMYLSWPRNSNLLI